jgi:hypothetical protein
MLRRSRSTEERRGEDFYLKKVESVSSVAVETFLTQPFWLKNRSEKDKKHEPAAAHRGYANVVTSGTILRRTPLAEMNTKGAEFTRRAQTGFSKLAPAESRLTLPLCMMAAIAVKMLEMGYDWRMGACLVMMYEGYLRPCDAMPLKVKHLIAPVTGCGAGHSHWSIVLHAFEEEKASKVWEFDESIILDSPEFVEMNKVWRRLKHGAAASLLFDWGYLALSKAFKHAISELHYDEIGVVHLYQVRHGGASHDAASRARPLDEIQKRGRWRSQRTMRRYENGGRLAEVLGRLRPDQLMHAQQCRRRLFATLCSC